MKPRHQNNHYREVPTSLWGDAAFRTFSEKARHLWLYLMTGPHTTSLDGLFEASEVGLAHKLGWSLEEFRGRWAEIENAGWGKADWDADVVWLPGLLAEGHPRSHTNVLGWAWTVHDIPECPLRSVACAAFVSRCLQRANEAAATSANRAKTLADWRAAIDQTFGRVIGVEPPGGDTVHDAPSGGGPDAPCHAPSGGGPDGGPDAPPDARRGKRKGKETPPPTPSGGNAGEEPGTQEDKDRHATAAAIVDHHIAATETQHCRKAPAVPHVEKLLAEGVSEESLRLASKTYADRVRETQVPKNRMGPTTFFGEGEWKTFRDGPSKPPARNVYVPPPALTPEEKAAQRERAAACCRLFEEDRARRRGATGTTPPRQTQPQDGTAGASEGGGATVVVPTPSGSGGAPETAAEWCKALRDAVGAVG